MAAVPDPDAAGPRRQSRSATPDRAATPGTRADGGRSVLSVLLALTVLSGLIDAVCYLGLGRVFTANMTGNIVVIGFAAAGAPGFSVPASLTSLGVFLIGAVAGGRLTRRVASRSRSLAAAITLEAVFVGAAASVACTAATVATGWGRYTTIALLAFAMGVRNAVIRRLSIPDMTTTTVLTMTLTGLAADSGLAGGNDRHAVRRVASALAMFAGALGGAALFLHRGPGLPLAIAAGTAACTAIAARVSGAVRGYLDRK
jgi:uncharacterized membrane protein YoaK (UPF0700 family)